MRAGKTQLPLAGPGVGGIGKGVEHAHFFSRAVRLMMVMVTATAVATMMGGIKKGKLERVKPVIAGRTTDRIKRSSMEGASDLKARTPAASILGPYWSCARSQFKSRRAQEVISPHDLKM